MLKAKLLFICLISLTFSACTVTNWDPVGDYRAPPKGIGKQSADEGLKAANSAEIRLLKASAQRGSANAQHKLATIYFAGNSAPKDLVRAYKWNKIAIFHGSKPAKIDSTLIAKEMTPEQLSKAIDLADKWLKGKK